jgi:hypothetical protein
VIYDAHKQAHNKEKVNKGFTVELESGKIKIGRIFSGNFLMAQPKLC